MIMMKVKTTASITCVGSRMNPVYMDGDALSLVRCDGILRF